MRYPPVGKCIYCGAEQYDSERKKLSDEHIIPLAASGDLILPEASCARCQRLTWKPEEQLLGLLGKVFRVMHRYNSRRRLPTTLPLKNVNGTGETRHIPIDIYPNGFALFKWLKPWLISGANKNENDGMNLWFDMDRRQKDKENLEKIGIYSWTGDEISNEMVFRMFAKIGHSYLAAELGVQNFRPLLLDYILRKNNEIMPFIGGAEIEEVSTDEPYKISWEPIVINSKKYAVVCVQLFSRQMGPTHMIVAGEI